MAIDDLARHAIVGDMGHGSFLSAIIFLVARFTIPPAELVELPSFLPDAPIIRYTAHTVQYSNEYRNPYWVVHELTAQEVETITVKRSSRFLPDSRPGITTATDADYSKSGYDRGHLAPAADMRFSAEAMRDCFYYSNISPQHPRLNRGIWLTLENQTRQWAIEYGSLFIAAGPVFSSEDGTIGENAVRVPAGFYKVLLDLQSRPPKAVGFLFPNTDSPAETLATYMVSVDEIEEITGIDFFAILPISLEALLESVCSPEDWLSGNGDNQ